MRRAALAITLAACTARAQTLDQQVDELAATHVSSDGPGLAIAIVDDGRIVIARTYGLADVATRRPMARDSVFDLASLGKQFTGAAILVLAQRGALSLDDDIHTYLPEVPAFDAARPIRIRDLAQHTSGLPEARFDGPATNTELLERLSTQTALQFPTGTKWRYTNLNYVLLATIIERSSGRPYAEFIRDEVFAPARMATAQVLATPGMEIRNRVTGYCVQRAPCRRDGADLGAANIFASLDDMIAWDAAWRRDVFPTKLLVAHLHAVTLESGMPVTYALGWGLRSRRGHDLLWHDGDWLGASTYIARYLDPRVTVIVLSNQARLPVQEIADGVADAYFRYRP